MTNQNPLGPTAANLSRQAGALHHGARVYFADAGRGRYVPVIVGGHAYPDHLERLKPVNWRTIKAVVDHVPNFHLRETKEIPEYGRRTHLERLRGYELVCIGPAGAGAEVGA